MSNKLKLSLSLVLVCLFTNILFAAGGILPGSGTSADPYLIEDVDDFLHYADPNNHTDDYWGQGICTKLNANIDLNGFIFNRAPISPDPISNNNLVFNGTPYSGQFNGNDMTISSLTIDSTGTANDYLALFGKISQTGIVANLHVTHNITSYIHSFNCGGLCGYNDGIIVNCSTSGYIYDNKLENFSRGGIGGLCGKNYGEITSSFSNATIQSNLRYYGGQGGLCGINYGSIINNYATGYVIGGDNSANVGGLCGINYGSIINNYATGSVIGGDNSTNVGGLCGNNNGSIANCYAIGSVSGDTNIGGLCGWHAGSTANISNSFWDVQTSNMSIGYTLNSNYPGTITNVQGLTSAEMHYVDTFTNAGWDFIGETTNGTDDIWLMDGYPTFTWIDKSDWIEVPNLVNISQSDAESLIVDSGFAIGDIDQFFSDSIPAGYCMSQLPSAGTLAPEYHRIEITISLGPWPIVPDLSGMIQADAEQAIIDAGLAVGNITFAYDDSIIAGNIINQTPLAGEVAASGSPVNLVISLGVFVGLEGNGIESDPFLIKSISDFMLFANPDSHQLSFWSKDVHTKLVADIDMENVEFYPATFEDPNYHGIFDGNGHTISNLNIEGNDTLGIFRSLSNTAVIKNLNCHNIYISGNEYLGSICGNNCGGTISDCYISGEIHSNGDYSGGICGYNYKGKILYCEADVYMISSKSYIGGLCGFNEQGIITDSNATGSIEGGSSSDYLGGLCGHNGYNSIVSNCYATGSVSGYNYLGGLCGYNSGTIGNSYATGSIAGGMYSDFLGGLSGENRSGTITNCFATGSIEGGSRSDYLGGLCGSNRYGSISNCYATGSVSGYRHLGGLCGYNYSTITNSYATGSVTGNYSTGGLCGYSYKLSENNCFWDIETSGKTYSEGGTGLTTAQMQDINTFLDAGWDFVDETTNGTEDLWIMDSYPTLAWLNSSGLIEMPDLTNLSQAAAEELIIQLGFNVGLIEYHNSDTIAEGCVISQRLPSGSNFFQGLDIDITLSLGPWPVMPDLINMPFDEALIALANTGLKLGEIVYIYGRDYPVDTVIQQEYDFGTILATDTYVNLSVLAIPPLAGNGTQTDPYLIQNVADFVTFANPDNYLLYAEGVYIRLENDIDLSSINAFSSAPVKDYSGIFEGNNKTISNLAVHGEYCGLFSKINNTASVKNINLENAVISGYENSGTLCAENFGTISNSFTSGSVTAYSWENGYYGGLCGRNSGTITNSYSTVSVTGDDYLGGLCGYNSGTISSSYATSSVTGYDDYIGGLCSYNKGTITNCYATGSVTGYDYLGGLCGINSEGTISNSYATSSITGGNYLGGLCGSNESGTISNCYFYDFSGWDNGIGTPLSETELQDSASFTGFNFVDIWSITPGYMPRLAWQESPGFSPPWKIDSIVTTLEGTGYENDPFIINDYEDMLEFRNNSSLRIGYYILQNDIDLSGATYTEAFIPEDFFGRFNGNGHTISNLTIYGSFYLGLFSNLNGFVDGLNLQDVSIDGTKVYLGGLCGRNFGSVSNCYATGSVSGDEYLGGLCGRNYGTVSNCYATGSVSGYSHLGGLCGYNSGTINNSYATVSSTGGIFLGGLCGHNSGVISNSYATGSITGSDYFGGLCGINYGSIINNYATGSVIGGYNSDNLGGLCGYNNQGTITNCYATGSITGGYDNLGGLCGGNYAGTISNSYATGSIAGNKYSDHLGGLCGANSYGTITNCYATGSITGDDKIGGLCGYNSGTISNSYATGSITGDEYLGGLCGYKYGSSAITSNSFWDTQTSGLTSSSDGTGLTTSQIQDINIFRNAGWDFVGETTNGNEDIWYMPDGSYPILAWQHCSPDINGDMIVNLGDFSIFATSWLASNADSAYSSNCDFDYSGSIDISDLQIFSESWLDEYILEPVYDPNCLYWPLDESSGTIAYDAIESKLNGTVYGDPNWVSGKINNCLEFDGVDDYISIPYGHNPLARPFSAFAWVKGGTIDSNNLSRVILCQKDGNGTGRIWLQVNENNKLGTVLTGSVLESDTEWDSNNWHHVGIVWDGHRRYIYCDGILVASDDEDINDLEMADGELLIGAHKYRTDKNWCGLIDDVRLYKSALSDTEIQQLYFMPLVGHWSMDESSGTIVPDSTSFANDGTIYGNPSWVSGKIGDCLDFDGNDYVSLPKVLDVTQPFTITTWVNLESTNGYSLQSIFQQVDDTNGGIGRSLIFRTGSENSQGADLLCCRLGSTYLFSNVAIFSNLNKWYHIAMVFDGTTIYQYIDGVLTGQASGVIPEYSDGNFRIGAHKYNEDQKWGDLFNHDTYSADTRCWDIWAPWDGLIDDVRIYNTALSSSEIGNLAQITN